MYIRIKKDKVRLGLFQIIFSDHLPPIIFMKLTHTHLLKLRALYYQTQRAVNQSQLNTF